MQKKYTIPGFMQYLMLGDEKIHNTSIFKEFNDKLIEFCEENYKT